MSNAVPVHPAQEPGIKDQGRRLVTHPAIPLAVQGVYYFLTGVWPLLSIDTFQAVTGPKTDLWLVHTVGGLITVIAVVLLLGALREAPVSEVQVLAIGSAVVLCAIDITYVAKRVISPIYLLDAALELALISWWVFLLLQPRKQDTPPLAPA